LVTYKDLGRPHAISSTFLASRVHTTKLKKKCEKKKECTQAHGSLSVVGALSLGPNHGKELKGGRRTIWYLLIAIASQ